LTIALLATLFGCSVKRNYKTLTFFFDGVPDPNAPVKLADNIGVPGSTNSISVIKAYQHKPFSEQKCSACHTEDKKHLISLKADLCITCHEKTTHEQVVMHTPVANGQCLWCHEPHESDQIHLLKSTSSQLCTQCHDREFLSTGTPEHLSTQANCLSCHVAHGGSKASMLRTDNPQIQAVPLSALPSTQPASDDDPMHPRGGPQ
jgi:predicted CXXCH cytochrome family protein